ncbi:MAG: HDOD domain-containing protein [Verrucomicrobiota bacterium]
MKDLEGLIRRPGSIPSLPMVYHHIQRVVNDPDANIEKIVEIIGEDPGLTVRLLRLANSSFYGFPQQIYILDEAVRLIGLKQVRDLCFGTVLIHLFPKDKVDPEFMEHFWKHNIACGIASRLIAQFRQQRNIDQYFIMGLVHDIGKLPIAIHMPEEFDAILKEVTSNGSPMYQIERKVLGYDHSEVGGLILNEWKMPDSLIQVVRGHHNAELISIGPDEIAVVHFANLLVHALGIGSSGEDIPPPFEEKSWLKLGLTIEMLPTLCEELDRQYLEVERIFLGT